MLHLASIATESPGPKTLRSLTEGDVFRVDESSVFLVRLFSFNFNATPPASACLGGLV